MKKHAFTLLITLSILLITSSSLFAINGNMGGPTQDGSEDHPYLIEDFNDFQTFASDQNYWRWNVHTRLDCDLDLDPNLLNRQTYTTAVIAPDINDFNYSFDGTTFVGIFNGNNHTISNLTISTTTSKDYLGLFGKINDNMAEVKNLGLENINITSGDVSWYIGSLCGENYEGNINNCYSTGSITVGENPERIGGLCGYNSDASINNCYSTISIISTGTNAYYLGGLCGRNDHSTITNCYAIGEIRVNGGADSLGGLCGMNYYGNFINCYSTGDISSSIDNSSMLGGLCGYNWGDISNCYSTGSVAGNRHLGGLCGYSRVGKISNCFWDIEMSEMTIGYNLNSTTPGTITNVIGKTTADMKTVGTFFDAGWDLVAVWNIEDGQSYPLLRKYSAFDTNYDNKVNFTDFADFANNWLSGVE